MAGKEQYYKLDDIGFVGTQDKGTPAQFKKDIEMTIQYIKDLKAGKANTQSRKKGTGTAKKGRNTKVK